MRVILITGTRQLNESGLRELQEWLCRQEYDVLLHGGAIGTDRAAAAQAAEQGKEVRVMMPDYIKYGGKAAPLMRNEELAKEAKRLGARVVAWQPCGRTKGTIDTVQRCLAHGNTVEIYYGGGEWKTYNTAQLSLI